MACARCAWSIDVPLDPNQLGQPRARDCRRFPPSIALVPSGRGASTMALPCIVAPNHWCYEYKPNADVICDAISDTVSDA